MKVHQLLENNKYVIFDGGFGTYYSEITSGVKAPEFGNVTNSNVVKQIHLEYINAGANVIRTNTFASNTNSLCEEDVSEEDKVKHVKENIYLAIAHAKEAIKKSGKEVLIAGDIGPISSPVENEYIYICDEFIKNDIKLIVFETFSEMDDIIPAINYIKEKSKDTFIIVQFCVNQFGYTNSGIRGERLLMQASQCGLVDGTGFNCGVGPGHLHTLMSKMTLPQNIYLTALPNASYPKLIKDRMVFLKNENYFVDKMLDIAELGIDFLGGCCGTKPDYIRLLSDKISDKNKIERIGITSSENEEIFSKSDESFYVGKDGKRLLAVELSPPLDADYTKIMDAANMLRKCDVDVLTFPDSPSGRTRADSILMATKVLRETGLCVMPHICCRDKNAIAMRSLILGAHINDINNFLVITGDPVSTLMRQDVKSVFNFDSCGLMKIMRDMNEEHFSKKPIVYGGAINQGRKNLDVEIERVRKKMSMGATFFFTQPIFSKDDAGRVRRIKEETGARILCGIMPLVSKKNALFIKNEMTGINVTDDIISMYEGVEGKEEGESIGIQIASDMMKLVSDFADGYYFSIPFNRVYLLEKIMEDYNG